MSTLQQLIEQHCPNGVEYVRLGDVMEMKRGTSITKKQVTPGQIPVIAGGRSAAYFHGSSNRSGETIVVAGSGAYAGHVSWWDTEIFVSDAFSIKPVNSTTCLRYVYHYMSSMQQTLYELKSSGGVPHVYIKDIAPLEIPLPPRVVQDKIVDYLDALAAVCNNLDIEIAQREQQFEVYQEQLLGSASNGPGVTHKPLKEMGDFYGGMTGKTKADFAHGHGRYIPYTSVFKNRSVQVEDVLPVAIKDGERQHAIQMGDILFTGSSETIDEVGYTSVVIEQPETPIYVNSFCFGFRFQDLNGIHPDYIKFLLMSRPIRKMVMKSANGVTRINISKKLLGKTLVLPLPPLYVQEEFADKLDTMQALIDNLKHERELRGQQFEFYRAQLLTFAAKDSTAND